MVLAECTCKNDFMDAKYGKGIRVHNLTVGKDTREARCTVCSTERKVSLSRG